MDGATVCRLLATSSCQLVVSNLRHVVTTLHDRHGALMFVVGVWVSHMHLCLTCYIAPASLHGRGQSHALRSYWPPGVNGATVESAILGVPSRQCVDS